MLAQFICVSVDPRLDSTDNQVSRSHAFGQKWSFEVGRKAYRWSSRAHCCLTHRIACRRIRHRLNEKLETMIKSIEKFLATSRLPSPLRIFKAQLRLTQRRLSLIVATSKFSNLVKTLDAFSPGVRGSYRQLSMQTLRTVQQLPQALKGLVEVTNSAKLIQPNDIVESQRRSPASSQELGRLFQK